MLLYLKAVAAAVITGLGALQIAYADNRITDQEWVGIGIATLVALGGVWAVPNKPADPSSPPPTT